MNVKTSLNGGRWLLTSLFLALLAGCSGGGGGSANTTPPPPPVIAVGPSTPTAMGGTNVSTTGSLYIQEAALTQTNYVTTSVANTLWDFLTYGTNSTNPYSGTSTSTYYGTLISDRSSSGNLFATENEISGGVSGGATVRIVEFPGGAGAATLTPQTLITLPAGVVVNSIAFDGSNNLWVDEADQADSAAKIVEYTSASGYASTSTVINYSATGASTGYAPSSILAFAMPTASVNPGVLYAFENDYNSSVGPETHLVAYNVTSTPGSATSVALPSAITSQFSSWTAQYSTLTVDQTGYVWLLSSGCASCSTALPAYIREFNPNSTSGSLLKTFTLPANFSNLGSGKGARPAFDSNNNLWFTASTGPSCFSGTVYGVYEIPSATTAPASTTPVTAYTSSTACNEFTAVAVVPALN